MVSGVGPNDCAIEQHLITVVCLGEGSWQTVTTTVTRGPAEGHTTTTTTTTRGKLQCEMVFNVLCKYCELICVDMCCLVNRNTFVCSALVR